MELVDRLKLLLLGTGARPVLSALIGLSVASLAVILERAWVFYRTRSPAERVIALLVGGGGTGGGARRACAHRSAGRLCRTDRGGGLRSAFTAHPNDEVSGVLCAAACRHRRKQSHETQKGVVSHVSPGKAPRRPAFRGSRPSTAMSCGRPARA